MARGTVRKPAGVFGGPNIGDAADGPSELAVDADLTSKEIDTVHRETEALALAQTMPAANTIRAR